MFNHRIQEIRETLTHPLPGVEAQRRMAPKHPLGREPWLKPNATTRQSAVLIALYPLAAATCTILIKRSRSNGAHSGQVSFPGGKMDPLDGDLIHTALRESYEEIGIPSNLVEVIGELTPLYISVSNLMVLPVVGVIRKKPNLLINRAEVEYCIHADIMDFKNPALQSIRTIATHGITLEAPSFNLGGEHVWGATAMIISEFCELYGQ